MRGCFNSSKQPKSGGFDDVRNETRFSSGSTRSRKTTTSSKNWSNCESIKSNAKNAYGEVEFHGSGRKTRAQFVRLPKNTAPSSVWSLLRKTWKLDLPKLIISVVGGKHNFYFPHNLRDIFKNGLWKVTEATGAWVITYGTDTGITKLVGESLRGAMRMQNSQQNKTHCIGIATWGSIKQRESLEHIEGKHTTYYLSRSKKKDEYAYLNNNHTHFLLVDDGTTGQFWKEIKFRNQLEDEIRRMVQIETEAS